MVLLMLLPAAVAVQAQLGQRLDLLEILQLAVTAVLEPRLAFPVRL